MRVAGMLAAGPIENLLGEHGPRFIDRVEVEAQRDPAFAFTLGGVWKYTMTDDVWDRLQRVAEYRGWDADTES